MGAYHWRTDFFRADMSATGADYTNQTSLGGIPAGYVLKKTLINVYMIYQGVNDITKPGIVPLQWGLWIQQDALPDSTSGAFDPLPHFLISGVMAPVPTPWNPTFAGSDRAWWVHAHPHWLESEAQRDIRVANPHLEFVTQKDPFDSGTDQPPEGRYFVRTRLLFYNPSE